MLVVEFFGTVDRRRESAHLRLARGRSRAVKVWSPWTRAPPARPIVRPPRHLGVVSVLLIVAPFEHDQHGRSEPQTGPAESYGGPVGHPGVTLEDYTAGRVRNTVRHSIVMGDARSEQNPPRDLRNRSGIAAVRTEWLCPGPPHDEDAPPPSGRQGRGLLDASGARRNPWTGA